jgi:hypothetical protein
MYVYGHQLSGPQLGENRRASIDQIRFIEAKVTKLTRQGRVQMSFTVTGAMGQKKREKFIKRFIDPMLKHDVALKLLVAINGDPHAVDIAWGNNQFGFTGTVAMDRPQALGGKGSAATIFIDEAAPDWQNLKTIAANPDVGLFHELVHARHIQQGTVVDDEREMERRVIGIGKYTKSKGTENHYRVVRGLPLRCCWEKETLEGIEAPYFHPPAPNVRYLRTIELLSRENNGVRVPQMGGFVGVRPRRSQGMRTPVDWSFGEPASTSEFSETERRMVASGVRAGVRGVNQLSDRVFFVRHPDRIGKLIDPRTEPNLAQEWKNIKGRLALPILEAIDSNEKGKQAMFAGQFTRAMGLFDRARRVSISPTQDRAAATFNLGIVSLRLKRFAAAIGYFEVVRSFPVISEELRAKAEKMFALAKQEYSNAVP